jgi:hypothetical protein
MLSVDIRVLCASTVLSSAKGVSVDVVTQEGRLLIFRFSGFIEGIGFCSDVGSLEMFVPK